MTPETIKTRAFFLELHDVVEKDYFDLSGEWLELFDFSCEIQGWIEQNPNLDAGFGGVTVVDVKGTDTRFEMRN